MEIDSRKTGKLDVIMFNMSSFSEWKKGRANRNRHVLEGLLSDPRVGKVLAVDYMPFTFKRSLRNYWENFVRGPKGKVVVRGLFSKCVEIKSSKFQVPSSKLYVYSTVASVFSEEAALKGVESATKKLGFENTVIWSYFPMFAKCFDMEAEAKVFDTVDNWTEHPAFGKYRKRLRMNYAKIAVKADLVFAVSDSLVDFYAGLGRRKDTHWIPNGIDVGHFGCLSGECKLASRRLKKISRIRKPVIGYLGVIQDRVDMNLVRYLAEKNPDKSVVMVGPVWAGVEKDFAKVLKNVHFLGPVPYDRAPEYLRHFDVGIIPHIIDDFTRSMNPLKLYEYLAAGKPVVTTPVAGTEKFRNLVYVADSHEAFNRQVRRAFKEDSGTLRRERRRAVKAHSWKSRVGGMLELLEKKRFLN